MLPPPPPTCMYIVLESSSPEAIESLHCILILGSPSNGQVLQIPYLPDAAAATVEAVGVAKAVPYAGYYHHVVLAYVLNQHHQLLSPHQRGSTDIPRTLGAPPIPGVKSRHQPPLLQLTEGAAITRNLQMLSFFKLLLLLSSSTKYHRVAHTVPVARTSSAISVVISQDLKHQPSDLAVAANAAEIFVVDSLHSKHSPSRSYETEQSTAIKC